uniref:T-cell immunoglobulin and mucin domain-containing protein 4-like n=1 Tax=Sinocyclocheilus anshuiensis TaxID=1608454 RepID=A0A671MTF3_9TELE
MSKGTSKMLLKCFHAAHGSSVLAFLVTEGSTVILSCHYSVKHHGLSHVCWGRDCGTFWCNDIIIQTDEYGVISKVSDRYKLIGDVLSGQMDLGIQKIQKTDSGPYCCRVDIEGFFNDKKVSYTLRVMKAPTTTTPIITEPLETQTVSSLSDQSRGADSSYSDISWQNVTHVHSGAYTCIFTEISVYSYSGGFYGKAFDSGCFSKEPRHIIYEIRTRRPVEENIYTLE